MVKLSCHLRVSFPEGIPEITRERGIEGWTFFIKIRLKRIFGKYQLIAWTMQLEQRTITCLSGQRVQCHREVHDSSGYPGFPDELLDVDIVVHHTVFGGIEYREEGGHGRLGPGRRGHCVDKTVLLPGQPVQVGADRILFAVNTEAIPAQRVHEEYDQDGIRKGCVAPRIPRDRGHLRDPYIRGDSLVCNVFNFLNLKGLR
jgi:hypothetical protein